MNEVVLRLTDGSVLVLPCSLNAITTYVVLEQESWFEKEIGFFAAYLRPGMNVLDIGANLGAYAIPMARRVGPEGRVFAYEPGSEARGFLARSCVENGLRNLVLSASGVSDRARKGHLVFGASSELNRLSEDGAGESIELTSLDDEERAHAWPAFDVVKIDAEGEELRILTGAEKFLARHSPLVMFEMRQAGSVSHDLIAAFRLRGFDIYRALAGAPLLVPMAQGDIIDAGELNLFAAKGERAGRLAQDGFLVAQPGDYRPPPDAPSLALDAFRTQAFSAGFTSVRAPETDYAEALAAFTAWRTASLAAADRYGALLFAGRRLQQICTARPTLPRLATLMRVSWELGWREVTVAAGTQFLDRLRRQGAVAEPFWPATQRFDATIPRGSAMNWFIAAALEQLERSASYSSFFGATGLDLDWLARQEFVATEVERRRLLIGLRAGRRMPVPERLTRPAADHLNAEIWRRRLVPNTI